MSITTHQRPGVYSDYDVSALIHGSGRGSVVGLAAINAQVESGQVWTITGQEQAAAALVELGETGSQLQLYYQDSGDLARAGWTAGG